MREGIPAHFYPDGQSGPYVARFLAAPGQGFTAEHAAELLGVAAARIVLAFRVRSMSEHITRTAIVAYCRQHPGEVWLWQQTYRSMARPPVHSVPDRVSDAP